MIDREKVYDAFRNCITEPKCRDCPWEQCENITEKRIRIPASLCLDVMEMLDDALNHSGGSAHMVKWISVEERLPENDDHVLCCTQTKAGRQNVVIGYYMDGMWRCGMNSNVTHWMPLPELPKEER